MIQHDLRTEVDYRRDELLRAAAGSRHRRRWAARRRPRTLAAELEIERDVPTRRV